MAPPLVEFEVDRSEVERALRGLRDHVSDLRPVLADYDSWLDGFFRKRFETAGAHGAAIGQTRWEPIEPSSVRGRVQNRGGRGRPLWDTGRLKRSWQQKGSDGFSRISDNRLERGSTLPRSVYHQHGYTTRFGTRVPARQIIPDPPSPMMKNELRSLMSAHLSRWSP